MTAIARMTAIAIMTAIARMTVIARIAAIELQDPFDVAIEFFLLPGLAYFYSTNLNDLITHL
jgi:hypothetical protein